MMSTLKATAAALALAGTSLLLGSAPASAGISFGITIGVPDAVAVDYDSGGYCDEWGCPDEYWGYPVWYGPVYYDGRWFNGPVYYRDVGGERLFWVHGGWRRDGWRGPRPRWWRSDYRVGPALGYDFYIGHGFRHGRDRYWRGNDWRPGRSWDRNRWDREHGGHDTITGHVRDVIGGHHDDHHDNDHHDNDHHDNDHHDHGGGMMGGGGHGSGGGGSMMGPSGGGNGGHGGGSGGGGGGNGHHDSGGGNGDGGHKQHGN